MICSVPYFEKGDKISLDEYPEVIHEVRRVYEEDFGFSYLIELSYGLSTIISEEELMGDYTLVNKG